MSDSAKADNPKLAIATITLACLGLSLGDALIKQQSATFVLWQIFALRSALVLPVLFALVCYQYRFAAWRPLYPGWTLLRSGLLVLMWIFYFMALPHIDFAIAAAAFYTLPLFIILFAGLFLGEPIRASSWAALIVGFLGVLLILQPQADAFSAWTLLPLVSALLYAVAMILTRSKCRAEKPAVLALWLNGCFILTGCVALLLLAWWNPDSEQIAANPFLFSAWTTMHQSEWITMVILATAILFGSLGAAIAYQLGRASTVSIFDFSYVGFAAIWGYLLFSEIPSSLVSIGILLIVTAGILASLGATKR